MKISIMDRLGLQPGRFRLLLVTLLAYCIGIAIVPDVKAVSASLSILMLTATALELWEDKSQAIRYTVVAVAALAVSVRILDRIVEVHQLPIAANLFDVIFAGGVTYAVQSAVTRPNRAAGDRIVGAICAYLLIGFAWAAIYSTIETFAPGSFRLPPDVSADTTSTGFLYYSFVTLSTLGYGDITPVTRLAGTLAWMEAIVGQLYIAITVAGLISLALAERRTKEEEKREERKEKS